MKTLMRLVEISRPTSWLYIFGPFLIGVAAGYNGLDFTFSEVPTLVVAGIYFLVPANMYMYGIEYFRTSNKNEDKPALMKVLVVITLLFIASLIYLLLVSENWATVSALAIFLVLGYGHSSLPIKLTTRLSVGLVCSVVFLIPGLVSYSIMVGAFPPPLFIIAAAAWCIATHLFSAILTIKSDKKSSTQTIATVIGRNKAIIISALFYVSSLAIIYPKFKSFVLIGVISYLVMIFALFLAKDKDDILTIQKLFPYTNMLLGVLFMMTALIG